MPPGTQQRAEEVRIGIKSFFENQTFMATKKAPKSARVPTAKVDTAASLKKRIESSANAKKAFSNFSLKTKSPDKATRTFVANGESVKETQRTVIQGQLETMKPSSPGLTIIVKDPKGLPLRDGQMDLATLINAMEKAKSGHVFYANRTSPLEQIKIQTHAEQIIAQIKKGGNQNG
jgi:hypothetical protein